MVEQRKDRLNLLQRLLPPGLLASAAWLREHDYPTNLVAYYVSSGKLESPARGVYRVPGPPLKWQSVVASLQSCEERSEAVVILLTPDLHGMMVATRTLQANAQKQLSCRFREFLRLGIN